jgi:hypothetical protein
MGGYDPGLYERQRLANIALRDAGINPYGGALDLSGYGGDSGDGYSVGDQGGDAAGNTGGGPGTGAEGDTAFAKGGLINRVAGPDPAGPDEGQISAQKGEYVIKKSSVNKYGKGLLDMLNDGKIPAKKMKSLLG